MLPWCPAAEVVQVMGGECGFVGSGSVIVIPEGGIWPWAQTGILNLASWLALQQTHVKLTSLRKKRGKELPEGLPTAQQLKHYTQSSSHPGLHRYVILLTPHALTLT